MAHFSPKKELDTETVQQAVKNILATGANIRTQSPVLHFVNDKWREWAGMWKKQTAMGMIPYYFFVVRDTGAQDYFAVSLERSWNIFRDAYSKISGLLRTVRGPSMSCTPGKVEITGITKLFGVKVFNLRFLQGRNPEWVGRPFYAKYDPRQSGWMIYVLPSRINSFLRKRCLYWTRLLVPKESPWNYYRHEMSPYHVSQYKL